MRALNPYMPILCKVFYELTTLVAPAFVVMTDAIGLSFRIRLDAYIAGVNENNPSVLDLMRVDNVILCNFLEIAKCVTIQARVSGDDDLSESVLTSLSCNPKAWKGQSCDAVIPEWQPLHTRCKSSASLGSFHEP